MSQVNVQVVRAAFEAWNSGDMDALALLYDSNIVVRIPEEWPEPGPLHGRDAVISQFRHVRETFEFDELIPGDFVDTGGNVVVRAAWRGRGQGPQLRIEWTFVYTLRKGKVILLEYFADHGEALEAVGLRE